MRQISGCNFQVNHSITIWISSMAVNVKDKTKVIEICNQTLVDSIHLSIANHENIAMR